MENNSKNAFMRLGYAIKELSKCKNTTLILGAGCSLAATNQDISTSGIMKQCLMDHGYTDVDNVAWEILYKKFINNVWNGKAKKEQKLLLSSKLSNVFPADGHKYLRALVEKELIHTIITTNFDMLLEKSFEGLSYRKKVGNNEYKIIGNSPTFDLLKIHGDLEEGEFRFSPSELMKLPDELSDEIKRKTAGLTIFSGYRGQDIGLMNSISTLDEYAIYWIDINAPNMGDVFSTQHIFNFMTYRNSANNFLYGKEFGDFHELMKKLYSFLITPSHNTVIKTKEAKQSPRWKNTSIIELLSIYTRVYELFLDILAVSNSICLKNICSSADRMAELYDEKLHSYLYFFNSRNLPSALLHIPDNEVDALILGTSIEVMVRSFLSNMDPKEFISLMRSGFNDQNFDTELINDSFWQSIEKVVSYDHEQPINEIQLNLKNNLMLKTTKIPLKPLGELIKIVCFLSLLVPTSPISSLGISSQARIQEFLNGKYESIDIVDDKLIINLGEISIENAISLENLYIKALPQIQKVAKDDAIDRKNHIVFDSRWIKITYEITNTQQSNKYDVLSFFALCQERSSVTIRQYLNLSSAFNMKSHIKLQFDDDLIKFIHSKQPAIFAVGTSGCGKTNALQHLVQQNSRKNELQFICISPKNSIIDKYGLSLFLDYNTDDINEDVLLENINSAFHLRHMTLILLFDGLNELNDTIEQQKMHYCYFVELASKLYMNNCTNIKLIITCRENAYYQYQRLTSLQLNHLHFYYNKNVVGSLKEKNDAIYRIPTLNDDAKEKLMLQYIDQDKLYQTNQYKMFMQNFKTPMFIAIAGEVFKQQKNLNHIKNFDKIYDAFAQSMLKRIGHSDQYLVKKIIYTYFDLKIMSVDTNIEITEFKILDRISSHYHHQLINTIDEMIDVNIFVKDNSNVKRIKFQHDKIEEVFFKEYIEEYEDKGISFFFDIFHLCKKNVIYQGGVLQYFVMLIKNNNLSLYKKLIISLSIDFPEIVPSIVIESLSASSDLMLTLQDLINEGDVDSSKKVINIILWGLDESLQAYSIVTYDLIKIIDVMLSFSNDQIISKDNKAYLYHFKSKLLYYINNYDEAQRFAKQAINMAENSNNILLSKINTHYSVLWMELGFSKKSIEILEKEFDYYNNINNIKSSIEIGIDLGRALHHSGQTKRTLDLYKIIFKNKHIITSPYMLARLYEQKANVLNSIMYEKLNYGFTKKADIPDNVLNEVTKLFNEAIALYDNSMKLLLETNAMFSYSGVVPEKINTYISYSYSIEPKGIHECQRMIAEVDSLLKDMVTPFKTDFYLAKAYYYEYIGEISKSKLHIEEARQHAQKLKNKNKEAKCNLFFSRFAYRRILSNAENINTWITKGLNSVNQAIDYYIQYTLIENNSTLKNSIILRRQFEALEKL